MLRKIVFLISLCLNFVAKSQIIDVKNQQYTNLGNKTSYYFDKSGMLGIRDVSSRDFQKRFTIGKRSVYNIGITKEAFWVRLIYSPTRSGLNYFIVDQANLDTLKLYYKEFGKTKEILSGNAFPLAVKSFKNTNFSFLLPNKNAIDTLYLRVTGGNSMFIPLKIANEKTLPSYLSWFHSLEAIYIGIFLSFFFFNIFLYFSVGDRSILAYSFYILFVGLFTMVCLRGYSHLLGETIKDLVANYGLCLAALANIFCISFTKLFLQLKYFSKVLCRSLTVMMILWGIEFVVTVAGLRSLSTSLLLVFSIMTTVLAIMAGSVAVVKGFHAAKKYVLAFILFLLSILYTVLCYMDVFPITDFTTQVGSIGSSVEIIFLSFALAERIKALRTEKELMEQANVKLINERNQYLETAVSEKTEALQVALDSLQTSNNMKDTLFNIVVHDMRSPLSNLLGLLNLKEENIITDQELKNYIGQTKEQVGIVQDRLSNLLLWSYTQMENKPAEPEWISLKTFFEEQIKMYDKLMVGKNIELNINIENEIKLWGDVGSLAVIARNLLDNAVKYTPDHGQILIGTEVLEKGTKVYVANTGEMPLDKITEILNSENMKITQNVRKGVGLGMLLCKEFATRMGATLEIESNEGMTSFWLIIPNRD